MCGQLIRKFAVYEEREDLPGEITEDDCVAHIE